MRDPVVVNYGKGVQALAERELAEAEGLKLAADQQVWAHGRLRGTTIKGEPDVPPELKNPIPPQAASDPAGGDKSGTVAATPKEGKK